jgi:hypothetical protein
METDNQTNEQNEQTNEQEMPDAEPEFKLTVRKLEMPVRPRGVLAE